MKYLSYYRTCSVLVVAGVLSLGSSLASLNSAVAQSGKPNQPANEIIRGDRNNRLPPRLANAVRRDLSRLTGLPPGQLKVVQVERRIWSSGCLDLPPRPTELCSQAQVPGWRIVLTHGSNTWIYHTDTTGQNVRLETQTSSETTVSLPRSVANAVLQAASRRTNLPISQLRIVQSERQNWDGCLGISQPGEACTRILIKGWLVAVEGAEYRLVYHTDATGSRVKLNEAASQLGSNNPSNLPASVRTAVLQAASGRTGLSTSELRIVSTERRTWSDGCLGLSEPGVFCTQALVEGWRVVVEGREYRLVYRTNASGSLVKLDEKASNIGDIKLPQLVADAVLQAATVRTGLPRSELRIVQSRQIVTDGCLGLPQPNERCIQLAQNVWEVTVEGGKSRLVYRSNQNGSQVRLDEKASNIGDAGTVKPVPIPASELPSRLEAGVVFRASSGGGIAGIRTETTLRSDGRVTQARFLPTITAPNLQEYRISPQQVQQFQQLLKQENFAQFNQLSYPAPQGAADFITVTFTGQAGATRYADIVQNQLPADLQDIISAWTRLTSR